MKRHMLDLDTIFDDDRAPGTVVAEPLPRVHPKARVTLRGYLVPDHLPEAWREWYEERAAIREYDGGQAREHAEAEALTETLAAMRKAGENLDGAC